MLGWFELACPTASICLFKVRLGVLSKTLYHICGKLNLPTFLFNVGLFTLINMDSLMFLAKPCPSFPIIWKLCCKEIVYMYSKVISSVDLWFLLLVRNRQRFLLVTVVYSNNNTSSYVQVLRLILTDFLPLEIQDSHRLFIHRNQLETPKQTFPAKLYCPMLRLGFKTFNQWECGDFNQWEWQLTSQWERHRDIKQPMSLIASAFKTGQSGE